MLARAAARAPSDAMRPQDILQLLFSALLKAQQAAPALSLRASKMRRATYYR
jgi:hypothetical protein